MKQLKNQTEESIPSVEEVKSGIELIALERQEQIEKHKWNDAEYELGELIAGAEFALHPHRKDQPFPFQQKQFADKIASKTKIQQLAVAGAFIAAEIDRIQGADKLATPPKSTGLSLQECKDEYAVSLGCPDWEIFAHDCLLFHCDGDINAVAELYASQQQSQQTQWIMVEDGLPEVGKDVLFYHRKYGKSIGWMFDLSFVKLKNEDGISPLGEFTHWMPLPKSPNQ